MACLPHHGERTSYLYRYLCCRRFTMLCGIRFYHRAPLTIVAAPKAVDCIACLVEAVKGAAEAAQYHVQDHFCYFIRAASEYDNISHISVYCMLDHRGCSRCSDHFCHFIRAASDFDNIFHISIYCMHDHSGRSRCSDHFCVHLVFQLASLVSILLDYATVSAHPSAYRVGVVRQLSLWLRTVTSQEQTVCVW